MKKLLTCAALLLALLLAVCCTASAEGTIVLSEHEVTLFTGRGYTLRQTVSGVEFAWKSVVTWESSDPDVVTVSGGTLIGKGNGTATVTATAALPDGTTASDTCAVTVETAVTALRVARAKQALATGVTTTYDVTVLPADATNQTLVWKSSDPEIATVDPETGAVTGVKKGHCVITAESTDGSARRASIKLTVEPYIALKTSVHCYNGYSGGGELHVKFKNITQETNLRGFGYIVITFDSEGKVTDTSGENLHESSHLHKPGSAWTFYHPVYVTSPAYIAVYYTHFMLEDGTVHPVSKDDQLPLVYRVHDSHTLTEAETLDFLATVDLSHFETYTDADTPVKE